MAGRDGAGDSVDWSHSEDKELRGTPTVRTNAETAEAFLNLSEAGSSFQKAALKGLREDVSRILGVDPNVLLADRPRKLIRIADISWQAARIVTGVFVAVVAAGIILCMVADKCSFVVGDSPAIRACIAEVEDKYYGEND